MKLKVGKHKVQWIDELSGLQLPFTLRYKFIIYQDCELIPHYSKSRSEWTGSGKDEGLTWYHATNRHDFTFRTGIFKSFPSVLKKNPYNFKKNRTYKCKITVGKHGARYWIDDKHYATCKYSEKDVLSGGTVGFMTWEGVSKPCLIKNLKLNNNVDESSGSDNEED